MQALTRVVQWALILVSGVVIFAPVARWPALHVGLGLLTAAAAFAALARLYRLGLLRLSPGQVYARAREGQIYSAPLEMLAATMAVVALVIY